MKESKQDPGGSQEGPSIGTDISNNGTNDPMDSVVGSSDSGQEKFSSKKKRTAKKSKEKSKFKDTEVNLDEYKVGGFTYKVPGKRQRVIVATLVLGLNALLALVVVLYFYNPSFKEFIFNIGRQ